MSRRTQALRGLWTLLLAAAAALAASLPGQPLAAAGAENGQSAARRPDGPASAVRTAGPAASAASAAPAAPASAASAPAEPRPVAPPASISSIALPPAAQCSAAPRPACVDPDPLSMERPPESLPSGVAGQRYGRDIRAEGGQPPYVFSLIDGSLPEGLRLDPRGALGGTPAKTGPYRFRLRVEDGAGRAATQTYLLRILPVRKAEAAASAASKPSVAPLLKKVDLKELGKAASRVPTAVVYQLQPAQLDALMALLKPADGGGDTSAAATAAAADPSASAASATATSDASAPTPPPPAGMAWSEDQQKQLQQWLEPLMGTEYPSRHLFLAAVDALACAHMRQLVTAEAQRLKQQAPSSAELAAACPAPASGTAQAPGDKKTARPAAQAAAPSPAAVSAAASAAASAAPPASAPATPGSLGWRELPGWLLPPPLRAWLAEAAVRERELMPSQALQWTAIEDCRCNDARASQPIYAIAPNWLNPEPPQAMDFGLIHRITPFALPLNQDLARDRPAAWTTEQVAFIETARRYGTRIDFGIYRRDWHFLATEPAEEREALLERLITQVPRHARGFLDEPLPGWKARAKAWLPGFGEVQRMGDGLTVYFDQLPDPAKDPVLAERFADFYPRFIRGLSAAMTENRSRSYVINLLINDVQLQQAGPFEVARLFDLLKAVEDPNTENGRIVETNRDYKRNSNVQLRFLVLLSEPSTDSKKRLRAVIEASPALRGGDRRIFLRSVVPVLVLPQVNAQQYQDDLVYMQDSFDGIGFWPSPLNGSLIKPEQRQVLRRIFVPEAGIGVSDALCGFVCPNRWALRLLFDLLLLAGALTWLALQWNCEWRAKYGRLALLAGVPPVIVGAALLQCDPALAGVRNSNAQLLALIAIPVIAALLALLKRKVEKP